MRSSIWFLTQVIEQKNYWITSTVIIIRSPNKISMQKITNKNNYVSFTSPSPFFSYTVNTSNFRINFISCFVVSINQIHWNKIILPLPSQWNAFVTKTGRMKIEIFRQKVLIIEHIDDIFKMKIAKLNKSNKKNS